MKVEIRNAGREARISGYVNAVERDSRRLPQKMCPKAKSDFVEHVAAGAFSRAISANPEIRMKFNHGRDVAGMKDGTLKLTEDNIGLYADAVVTDPEVVTAAKNGELRGWSFGFRNPVDSWEDYNGIQRRNLSGFELDEVSILTKIPAYFGTSVEVRSLDENGEPLTTETRSIEDAPTVTQDNSGERAAKDNYGRRIALLKLKGGNYEE